MIFVTVGTHEQPFNRLLKKMDQLVENGTIQEQVIIQAGYSTYNPKKCNCSQFLTYQQMWDYVREARIVITHGGPSSFIMPLQIGKIPIVVPRQAKYDEHVNNHQFDFANQVAERKQNIIVVDEIDELGKDIQQYERIVSNMSDEIVNNNERFNENLVHIVNSMLESTRKSK
ncbi:glycosyltransferase [Lacticaseibacillus jixiensis]|uniref:glycosyltransferase n=1 Tax=Lacticaseibacillus jixiensis TaxID=3231926 RepID=UPI0036F271B9